MLFREIPEHFLRDWSKGNIKLLSPCLVIAPQGTSGAMTGSSCKLIASRIFLILSVPFGATSAIEVCNVADTTNAVEVSSSDLASHVRDI